MLDTAEVAASYEAPFGWWRHLDVPLVDAIRLIDLGATYDEAEQVWFIPQSVDPVPFAPWIATLRASAYGVLLAKLWCVRCANLTRVAGLVLPQGHESVVQQGAADRAWIAQPNRFIPVFVDVLSGPVLERIHRYAPRYARVQDETWGEVYQNHCEHCGKLHSDRELYGAIDGALDYREIGTDAIACYTVAEPFLGRSADGIDADQCETNPDFMIRNMRRSSARAGVR